MVSQSFAPDFAVGDAVAIANMLLFPDFGCPGKPNYYGLIPSEANFIMPGKKPLSSMAPTLIFKKNEDKDSLGDLFMALVSE